MLTARHCSQKNKNYYNEFVCLGTFFLDSQICEYLWIHSVMQHDSCSPVHVTAKVKVSEDCHSRKKFLQGSLSNRHTRHIYRNFLVLLWKYFFWYTHFHSTTRVPHLEAASVKLTGAVIGRMTHLTHSKIIWKCKATPRLTHLPQILKF